MEGTNGLYFQNMTMKDVDKRLKKNDLIIIPIGSTETHGPHAPYGEDTYLVTRMAEVAAKATGCTIAQPLWYGAHPFHHLGMPGTIILDDDVFKAVIRSVMAGFWNAGFRKQILLNGHGQEYVIPSAMHQFAKRYQVPGIFLNLNWYYAIPEDMRDKAHGGPFETPFIHADEVETSYSLALFPEMLKMEDAVDTKPTFYLKNHSDHVDKAGNAYGKPIAWYGHVGLAPVEYYGIPEGVAGKASLASGKKAERGVKNFEKYLTGLINDIMERFPAGVLPPTEHLTQRSKSEIDALLKGPTKGGKSIYTVVYPP